MASLKCLACGHDNKVGDESCTSCSSSLNLRLCSACEAINANSAERCHSCGARFSPEAEVTAPVEEVSQEPPAYEKVLPAAWVIGADQATRRSRRVTAAVWLAPVLAVAGATYYFYGTPQPAPKQVAAVPPAPAAAAQILELRTPPPEIKQPPTPKAVAIQTAPAPTAETKTAFEPKRALAPVTHTRTGGVATPLKTIPAAAPAAPAAAPAAPAVVPAAPAVARVTHTKGEPSAAPEAGAGPSVVAASVPGTAAKVEPAPCAPAVAALGLCKSH